MCIVPQQNGMKQERKKWLIKRHILLERWLGSQDNTLLQRTWDSVPSIHMMAHMPVNTTSRVSDSLILTHSQTVFKKCLFLGSHRLKVKPGKLHLSRFFLTPPYFFEFVIHAQLCYSTWALNGDLLLALSGICVFVKMQLI